MKRVETRSRGHQGKGKKLPGLLVHVDRVFESEAELIADLASGVAQKQTPEKILDELEASARSHANEEINDPRDLTIEGRAKAVLFFASTVRNNLVGADRSTAMQIESALMLGDAALALLIAENEKAILLGEDLIARPNFATAALQEQQQQQKAKWEEVLDEATKVRAKFPELKGKAAIARKVKTNLGITDKVGTITRHITPTPEK